MTENVYRGVVFDGVCTDVSNAAYPVERVRGYVERGVDERYVNTAVHVALTLIHHDIVAWNDETGTYETRVPEDGFAEAAAEALSPRLREDGDKAAFFSLVWKVTESLVNTRRNPEEHQS